MLYLSDGRLTSIEKINGAYANGRTNLEKTRNVLEFLEANKKSPVIKGIAVSGGGRGSRYILKNGKKFILNREECAMIGCPKWDI
jgi:hypothetical protein